MEVLRYTSALFFGSAVAGAGSKLGRDLYKKFKDNWFLLVSLAGIIVTFICCRSIIRYHDREIWGTIFKTLIFNALGMTLGCILTLAPMVVISLLFGSLPVVLAVIAWGITAIVGLLIGLFQRGKRRRMFELEKENATFLDEHNFKEVKQEGVYHVNGETVRLMQNESSQELLSFIVVGRRNKRFFIKLDEKGRMQELTKNF